MRRKFFPYLHCSRKGQEGHSLMPFRGCDTFLALRRLARGANKVIKGNFSLTELDGRKLSSLPPLDDRSRQLVRPEGVKARSVWVKRSLCFLRGCLWWWDPMEKVNLISACNKTSQSSGVYFGYDCVSPDPGHVHKILSYCNCSL